jgi:hypothetical protein
VLLMLAGPREAQSPPPARKPRVPDMTGQRFGELVVIARAAEQDLRSKP